ncbi:MAG: glycosyltransferase family 39 protein [Bacteroidales bacterium]|nr:glycosyltransferase family 39 protein [Bacteroidales bacterium]
MKDRLSPNALLLILLIAWWVVNVLQGAFTELADDEAYYWTWAMHDGGTLEWGYHDHPPMVALLIWFTQWMGGTLGVRFAALLLQPFYLWLLWTLVRPRKTTYRHVLFFAALCFAMPALQLYGLLVLPDAPLLCFSVLFLWSYKRMLQRSSVGIALIMGLAMALLAYSKYHGALVVALVLISNPRLLRSWHLYLALMVAAVLFVPHLLWQYQHGWTSLVYHLGQRHKGFDIENPLMFCLNLLLFFNPLLVWHYGKSFFHRTGNDDDREWLRSMRWLVGGFVVFFFVASWRGSTQAQWLLPVAIGLVVLLMHRLQSEQNSRYLRTVYVASAALFLIVRLVVAINPMHLKGQLWDNAESYGRIASVADGRPVLFSNYSMAAKYAYYTRRECYCQSVFYDHRNQWDIWQDDRRLYGRSIIREIHDRPNTTTHLKLANGKTFHYSVQDDYRAVREVQLWLDTNATALTVGDSLWRVPLKAYNPYPYAISSGQSDSLLVGVFYRYEQRRQPLVVDSSAFCLPAGDTTSLVGHFRISRHGVAGPCLIGFVLRSNVGHPSAASPLYGFSYNPDAISYSQSSR